MKKDFDYLKKEFPKIYRNIVLKHKAVNQVISFCDKNNQYLLFTGMFHEVNGGKGISSELEIYFVNFLIKKYKSKAFARASAYVEENQTKFIGFDLKSIDNEVWAQQNFFYVDEEGKVTDVDEDFTNSSKENNICPLVASYFEEIDLPEDTLKYLNDLYEQVKPSIEVIKLKE